MISIQILIRPMLIYSNQVTWQQRNKDGSDTCAVLLCVTDGVAHSDSSLFHSRTGGVNVSVSKYRK